MTNRATSDLGVVDPIRVPSPLVGLWAMLVRAWNRLPNLGRLFVALTAGDILARALGLAGMSLGIELSYPITLVSAFLPHDLLILLPAVLIARRHDAPTATPLVFRSAVLLSLVTLLTSPLSNAAAAGAGEAGFVMATSLAILATVLRAVGWLGLGNGLRDLAVEAPRPTIAGLANVVFVLLAASAIVALTLLLVLGPPDLGDPLWTTLSLLSSALVTLESVAFAYLARVVVRGTVDPRRPPLATYLASASMGVAAVAIGIVGVLGVATLVQLGFKLPGSSVGGLLNIGWVGTEFPLTAFLIAFGLGLADTSDRKPVEDADARPADDGPEWPTIGAHSPAHHAEAFSDPDRQG